MYFKPYSLVKDLRANVGHIVTIHPRGGVSVYYRCVSLRKSLDPDIHNYQVTWYTQLIQYTDIDQWLSLMNISIYIIYMGKSILGLPSKHSCDLIQVTVKRYHWKVQNKTNESPRGRHIPTHLCRPHIGHINSLWFAVTYFHSLLCHVLC